MAFAKAFSIFCVVTWPVGLCGLLRTTMRVRGPIASARPWAFIWPPAPSKGTRTTVAWFSSATGAYKS